jgi:dimethylamine/trimethylamine dehydrogenase
VDSNHEILFEPVRISEAIFEGHRLAREIDGTDPSIPLPFDRERELPTGA